jgi:hypothetical protein
VKYQKEFFDLQLQFARHVAEISDVSLERAILDYTNIYVRLAIGRGFSPDNPVWLDYVDGLRCLSDVGEWTYRFYLARPHGEPPGVAATFGCFSYAPERPDRIRIHFENRDTGPGSPLGAERADARRDELRLLFAHVERTQPDVREVAGVSWLYNLPAYRRLFPETYLASAKIAGARFRNMPLWGQFLDRQGRVKQAAANTFRDRLSRQSDLDGLAHCFPLQPLAVEASVSDFYRFHGLTTRCSRT